MKGSRRRTAPTANRSYARQSTHGCPSKQGWFFFQAEDGIREYKVTGVQTCALPICQVGQVAAGCDQLAELVLGEQGVRLALRVLECASPLALERVDPGGQRALPGGWWISHRRSPAAGAAMTRLRDRGDPRTSRRAGGRG